MRDPVPTIIATDSAGLVGNIRPTNSDYLFLSPAQLIGLVMVTLVRLHFETRLGGVDLGQRDYGSDWRVEIGRRGEIRCVGELLPKRVAIDRDNGVDRL